MYESLRRIAMTALVGLAVSATATPAQAQNYYSPFYRPGVVPGFSPINTNPFVAPGVTLQQYAYNRSVMTQAAYGMYPYQPGFSPTLYQSALNAYAAPNYMAPGTPYYAPTAYNPYLSTVANPYAANPYLGGTGAYGGGYGGPVLSTTPGTAAPYDTSLSTLGYGGGYGGSPYGGYGYDPYGSALRGVADLTNATAQYQVTVQRARLLGEEVTRSRLDTRRRIIEEAERERRMIPSPEEIRGREQQSDLERARREPPVTEIFAGRSLNTLLAYLQTAQGKGLRGPNVPLDEIEMNLINVVPQGENGNIGLVRNIKDKGDLAWPTVLQGEMFKEAREAIEARLVPAVLTLRGGNAVGEGAIKDLEVYVQKMLETLNNNINDLSPSQYIQAKRFLNQLQDAIIAMKSPKAVNYFNGEWTPKGKNVAELVHNMKEKGLKFAPAAPGNEGAYRALHHAMAAYDANMTATATRN
jgi:hypothetical protein